MSDKYPGGFVTANAPAGFSVAFDGTGDGFSYTGTTFGSGAWTAELWFYFTGTSFTGPIQLFEGTTNSLVLAIMSSTTIRVDQVNVSNDLYTVPTMSANTWYHLAATKDASGNQTLFLNGVRSSTGVTTTSRNFSSATLRIAYSEIGGTDFTGYFSNLRFVTGTAVYNPLSTTINVPTQLFPISGTQLLICQSPTTIDNSSNAYTLTASGTPKVSNFTPFAAFSGSLVPRTSPQTASGVWTIDEAAYFTTQGLWPVAPDVPQKSLRFNSPDNASLTRTPATASNRKTWTWSGWLKRSKLGSRTILFTGGVAGTNLSIEFTASNEISVYQYSSSAFQFQLVSTMLFRDVSAWYNVVVSFDTTQATSTNRTKVWINGTQVTSFSTASYPSLNTDYIVNSTVAHNVGDCSGASLPFDGYMTEVNFVDGQALDPTAFGAFEGGTGVWSPAPYNGTYGTNGFYLRFFDNSNTTAATLGKDSSPNGNNYTPNNFSVTAGSGNDSLLDTPNRFGTDTGVGGQVGGNYCTLNPLAASSSSATITNGNLDISIAASVAGAMGTTAVVSGKWYWEFTAGTASQNAYYVSVCDTAVWFPVGNSQNNMFLSAGVYTYYGNDGSKINAGSSSAYGNSFTSGDVIGIALDLDNGKVWFAKNGTWQNSGSPTGGTNAAFTTLAGKTIAPWIGNGASSTSSAGVVNFGQRAFVYTAPSGFKALVSTNLPTPAVGASNATLASKNFDVSLWAGNNTSQAITNSAGFQPDFVWVKDRTAADNHLLVDSVRGATSGVYATLFSNLTSTEETTNSSTNLAYGLVSAINSNGFTVAAGANNAGATNLSGRNYAGWQWKGGGTAVTNTAGSISSQVSANPTAGFSVVTYTGNGTSGATVGHGIGSAVQFIIVKQRGTGGGGDGNWLVGATAAIGWTGRLILNGTQANEVNSSHWNNTAPTSSVFTLGNSGNVNGSTGNYVAYCFAEVAGFSKFGSYTGNGSADGPFVYCGFRPRFVIVKNSSDAGVNWLMFDTSTNPYNVLTKYLLPNSTATEQSDLSLDILSNGFKPRVAGGTGINSSGSTYIFIAFAEAPFNYSRAR